MSSISVQRVEHPSEDIIVTSIELFDLLMKDDVSAISLCGGDPTLIRPMAGSIIRACALGGEYYTAVDTEMDKLVGFAMWMPPGHELFESEEQRKLGFEDLMKQLPEAGKQFYKDVYLKKFPGFVNECLGPTGRRDSWWLHQVMVRPEYQRKGIATSLISLVKQKAAPKNEVLALSVTTESNVPVYTSLDFEIKGRISLSSPWGDYPLVIFSFGGKPAA